MSISNLVQLATAKWKLGFKSPKMTSSSLKRLIRLENGPVTSRNVVRWNFTDKFLKMPAKHQMFSKLRQMHWSAQKWTCVLKSPENVDLLTKQAENVEVSQKQFKLLVFSHNLQTSLKHSKIGLTTDVCTVKLRVPTVASTTSRLWIKCLKCTWFLAKMSESI